MDKANEAARRPQSPHGGTSDLRPPTRTRSAEKSFGSSQQNETEARESHDLPEAIAGLRLNDTTDSDTVISHAPAVVHETIKPHVHEIIEEQVYREVHTYDEYHRIQPVYDIEVLPTRHYVPNADGGLTEVSETDVPFPSVGQPRNSSDTAYKSVPLLSGTATRLDGPNEVTEKTHSSRQQLPGTATSLPHDPTTPIPHINTESPVATYSCKRCGHDNVVQISEATTS